MVSHLTSSNDGHPLAWFVCVQFYEKKHPLLDIKEEVILTEMILQYWLNIEGGCTLLGLIHSRSTIAKLLWPITVNATSCFWCLDRFRHISYQYIVPSTWSTAKKLISLLKFSTKFTFLRQTVIIRLAVIELFKATPTDVYHLTWTPSHEPIVKGLRWWRGGRSSLDVKKGRVVRWFHCVRLCRIPWNSSSLTKICLRRRPTQFIASPAISTSTPEFRVWFNDSISIHRRIHWKFN